MMEVDEMFMVPYGPLLYPDFQHMSVLYGRPRTPRTCQLWNLHLLIQSLQRLQKLLRCCGHVTGLMSNDSNDCS